MPAAIVVRLSSEVLRILALPDVRQRYDQPGISLLHTTPEKSLDMLRIEIPQNAKMLAAIGLMLE